MALNKGHFTHELRAVTMKLWEPKRKCSKVVPTHLQNHVVWCESRMWPSTPPNAISMNSYSCGSWYMIRWNKSTVVSMRSAIVSWFCVRPTSKRWFLKIIQVTVKHDPFGAMYKSMWTTLHPSRIHILRWSLKCSVKRTWTGSAFSTKESAWGVMVTGSHSCVWSGPYLWSLSKRDVKFHGFDPSLRESYTKSSLACCIFEHVLKVGWNFWDFLFSLLKLRENSII